MSYKFLILFILLFAGCDGVNKEELRALNAHIDKSDIKVQEKILTFAEKSLPTVIKPTDSKDIAKKIEPVVVSEKTLKIVPKYDSVKRFKLALAQIKKEKELKEKQNREFQLSVIKLANENELKLKLKDIDLKKAEVDGSIALAEVELEKVKESEKTKLRSSELTHREVLLQSRNKFEKDKQDAIFEKDRLEFYKIVAAILGFVLLIYLVASYLFKSFKEKNRVTISENELTHKMQLKMLEIESKNFDKMLDLVSSGNLPENVEGELLLNIKESQSKRVLIEQKRKRGLVFRQ